MKAHLQNLLSETLRSLQKQGELPADLEASVQVEHTRDSSHGDFATNLAMTLAKAAKRNPRDIAQLILNVESVM